MPPLGKDGACHARISSASMGRSEGPPPIGATAAAGWAVGAPAGDPQPGAAVPKGMPLAGAGAAALPKPVPKPAAGCCAAAPPKEKEPLAFAGIGGFGVPQEGVGDGAPIIAPIACDGAPPPNPNELLAPDGAGAGRPPPPNPNELRAPPWLLWKLPCGLPLLLLCDPPPNDAAFAFEEPPPPKLKELLVDANPPPPLLLLLLLLLPPLRRLPP